MLFNVVKHSGVLQATVSLENLDGRGCVIVSDHGRGFDAEAIMGDRQAAHGLLIVRDRLNLMSGSLNIESVPGNGTKARIEFPMEAFSSKA
jgi:signal transduction histidine kinase